ncbi:4-coumarate--CoA ligase-like 9 [Humulus lupulus]|uniref:4-coumarate--CoA ligase-like 9 n=1 Tax=Humulus lupulus TaxID=3486 RepID=UPI002B40FC9E|nr:4-coumarate--CoA ligase-like 9 [Humulus lupulus]
MAMENTVDPRSGFNSLTKTFQSLRPPMLHLPLEHLPLSAAEYTLTLLRNCPWNWQDSLAFIDSDTGHRLSYADFTRPVQTLAVNLQTQIGLTKGDTAFVLSPNSLQVPILYFALLTLGVVISPANPVSTKSEIARLFQLRKPAVAFATSATAHKLGGLIGTIISIDSPEFDSLVTTGSTRELNPVGVSQSDVAVIMYSSGTTGRVKGAMLTHRNLISLVASFDAQARRVGKTAPGVLLKTVPYFHIYGFIIFLKGVGIGDTEVLMERYELRKMLKAIEEFKVTTAALVPPIVVALVKGSTQLTAAYNLSSLQMVGCSGSALRKEIIEAFKARFPNIALAQGYGLTETAGAIFRPVNPEESLRWGSSGKISEEFEAKIVDPKTGDSLPPCKEGELWIKGPSIMKGYIGDDEASKAAIVEDEGGERWLKTGDLCYIDHEGFLFVVDRFKELIKYKGFQVAPAELEQLLQSHPEIIDAAVIPYPDEEAGEVPMGVVVLKPNSILGESEVMNFVAKQVSPYKKIRRVAFVDTIPKNTSGKILRNELCKIFNPHQSCSRL